MGYFALPGTWWFFKNSLVNFIPRWCRILVSLVRCAPLVKNSGSTWWIFVWPGRVFVKNLVNNQVPPGLLQRGVVKQKQALLPYISL